MTEPIDDIKRCGTCGDSNSPYTCSTGQYCERHKRNAAEVMRWVPTFVRVQAFTANDGSTAIWRERRLMRAGQGADTFATKEESDRWIALVTQDNSSDTLKQVWGENPEFASIECPCWPGHFDPKRVIFDA